MATEEARVRIFSCDDPSCRTRIIWEADDEGLPDGFHGDVSEIGSFGGRGAKWFACRPTHIRAAVEGAIERESRPPE